VGATAPPREQRPGPDGDQDPGQFDRQPEPDQSPWFQAPSHDVTYQGGYDPTYDPSEQYAQWYEEQQQADEYRAQFEEEPPAQEPSPEETGSFPIPVGPNRTRELGEGGGPPEPDEEAYYKVFRQSIDGSFPTPAVLGENIETTYGVPLTPSALKALSDRFQQRYNAELEEDHIA
jgi:hypothetical protein